MALPITGLIVIVIGLIVGSQKAGMLCGSPLSPESHAAELYDTLQGAYGGVASCDRSIAAAAVPTWILIVLGIVLVLTGIIVRAIGNNRPTIIQPVASSVATQLEELARLHRHGLISAEEFDVKRVQLLKRL